MDKVLAEIPKEHHLHHVEQVMDSSQPHVDPNVHLKTWDKEGLMHDIQEGVNLKHVATDDRSQPHIDPNVHLEPNHHKELMTEVKAAAAHMAVVRELDAVSNAAGAGDGDEDVKESPIVAQLHHVMTDDKGKPAIDPSTHVQKWDKEGFLQDVAAPHHLRHVDPTQVHDSSTPAIPSDAHVGVNPAVAVLQQIGSGGVPHLRHVDAPQ